MEVTYRELIGFGEPYGRKRSRQIEARVGDISRMGPNKSAAKAAVLEAVAEQAAHAYDHRYLAKGETVFALSYRDGWCYDIIHAGRQGGSTCFDASSVDEALARMRHHFDQYTEVVA